MNKLFLQTMKRICERDKIKNYDLFTSEVWFSCRIYPSNPINRRVKNARDEYFNELKK